MNYINVDKVLGESGLCTQYCEQSPGVRVTSCWSAHPADQSGSRIWSCDTAGDQQHTSNV